ncbi:MAG TPA: TolC family protein [Bacteroidota bacterium]|nr:TolC family protein [Bacteroidota bacterium]
MPRVALAALLVTLFTCLAECQTIVTLDQCLSSAREHNMQLKISEHASKAAVLSREELMTTRLPQVELEGTALYAPSSSHFGYDPIITNSGEYAGQVVGKQSIYDGGIRSLRADQLGVEIDLQGMEGRVTARDVVLAVKESFYESLRKQEEIRLERESVGQLREYLERVKELAGAANASTTDILKTRVQLSEAEISLRKAEGEYAAAKYELSEVAGFPIDTSFSVSGSLGEDGMSDSLDTVLADSADNLDLSIAALAVQRNQLDIELTRHELAPTLSLVADAGLLTSRDNLRLPSDERMGILGYSIGLLLEVPLLNWGATDYRVQQKESQGSILQLQSNLLRRSVSGELKRTRLELAESRRRLLMLRENTKAAEENFTLTRAKYVAGNSLSLEVLSAQQLLTDSRLAELETLTGIKLQQAKLEQLLAR